MPEPEGWGGGKGWGIELGTVVWQMGRGLGCIQVTNQEVWGLCVLPSEAGLLRSLELGPLSPLVCPSVVPSLLSPNSSLLPSPFVSSPVPPSSSSPISGFHSNRFFSPLSLFGVPLRPFSFLPSSLSVPPPFPHRLHSSSLAHPALFPKLHSSHLLPCALSSLPSV